MVTVNALVRLSCAPRESRPGWLRREMRTWVLATERVCLKQLMKETAKDSGWGWEWGKG